MTENRLIGSGRRHLQLSSVPIYSTFPSVVLLNGDFSTQSFEHTVETQPVSVVHIASHGEFRPEASESFVLTYAGKLSMNRLAQVIARTRLRADALRAAQMSLLADHRFAHPIYWSPFLMIGSWL
jgi:CHAT domain-containing protein